MAKTAIAALRNGVRRTGATEREVELRAVTGEDELALAELAMPISMAARTTELLARTLERIGAGRGASREEARALSVGDRERLLLELYVLSFGPRIEVLAPESLRDKVLNMAHSVIAFYAEK